MSLENMNKSDLVKEARRLSQELKYLNAEMEELKRVKEIEDVIDTESTDLPFMAISIIFNHDTQKTEVHTVNFDLDGRARVNMKEELQKNYDQDYKAFNYFERLRMEFLERQFIKKEEESNE